MLDYSEKKSEKDTKNKISNGTYYSNIDKLPCDKHEVIIISNCVANDASNSDPYCFSQTAVFKKKKSRTAKVVNYYYQEDKQHFIYGVTCLAAKKEFYIELKNSNLGNCAICEWSDYFNQKGQYIASTNGMPNETSFKKRNLSKELERELFLGVIANQINLTTIAK
jgi:hypothetical protein